MGLAGVLFAVADDNTIRLQKNIYKNGQAAASDNAPQTTLNVKLSQIKADEAQEQAAEDARLDVSEPIVEKLKEAATGSSAVAQVQRVCVSE